MGASRTILLGLALVCGTPAAARAQHVTVVALARSPDVARASNEPTRPGFAVAARPRRALPFVAGGALLGAALGTVVVVRSGGYRDCTLELAAPACRLMQESVIASGAGVGALIGLGVAQIRRRSPATQ
jgi:hypothetical protein